MNEYDKISGQRGVTQLIDYRHYPFYAYAKYLNFLLRHPLFCFLLILCPLPRLWRPLVHDIAYTPQHTLLVRFFAHIVIWADDVELPIRHLLVHVLYDLLGGPCAIRFGLVCTRYIARIFTRQYYIDMWQ
jgi:hypothetical protein